MKFFENKKIWKKVVIMLLLIIFFQFGFATPVKAGDDGNGGILTGPRPEGNAAGVRPGPDRGGAVQGRK